MPINVGTTPSAVTAIGTGNAEIDKKLGGGIPIGSLVLLEGQSDSGKSVVAQHFAFGALTSKLAMAYYTSENTVKSLMSQMSSLNLDVTDYFLCDRMRVFPLEISSQITDSREMFQSLVSHMENLPMGFKLIIVDSLTGMVTHSDDRVIIDFFAYCKRLCDQGRTIMGVIHSYALDNGMLIRLRSLCDAHLVLRAEQVGERLVKMMEVAKVRNAELSTGNIISFDVEPDLGMKIIPILKARA